MGSQCFGAVPHPTCLNPDDRGNMFFRSVDDRLRVDTVPQPISHNLNNNTIIDFLDIFHHIFLFKMTFRRQLYFRPQAKSLHIYAQWVGLIPSPDIIIEVKTSDLYSAMIRRLGKLVTLSLQIHFFFFH